jgi:hypothetical protein
MHPSALDVIELTYQLNSWHPKGVSFNSCYSRAIKYKLIEETALIQKTSLYGCKVTHRLAFNVLELTYQLNSWHPKGVSFNNCHSRTRKYKLIEEIAFIKKTSLYGFKVMHPLAIDVLDFTYQFNSWHLRGCFFQQLPYQNKKIQTY